MFFKSPHALQLLDDRGEGVWDDSDHDQQGEEEDADCGHDELDIQACDTSIIIKAVLTTHSPTR